MVLHEVFVLRLKLLIADRVELLKNIYEHGFLCLNISLISITHKIHIDFSVSSFPLLISRPVERVLLVELVEVLIAYLRADLRNVRWSHLAHVLPVDALEEGMRLDFIDAVATQSCLCVANQSLQNICRCL